MGKLMEKAGGLMKNEGMKEKGLEKREAAGANVGGNSGYGDSTGGSGYGDSTSGSGYGDSTSGSGYQQGGSNY